MAIKKPKLLTMKVDETEKARWQQISKDRGVTLAELIRTRLDDLPAPKKRRQTKPIIEVDPRLLFEVNAIGNNLNQIARINTSGEKLDVLLLLVSIEAQLVELVNARKVFE